MKELLDNDKSLVIIAVLILAVASLFVLGPSAKEIISNTEAGLFGLVVGSALSKKNGQ